MTFNKEDTVDEKWKKLSLRVGVWAARKEKEIELKFRFNLNKKLLCIEIATIACRLALL